MSKLNFEYVPLTFINDKEEIKKQVRNTLILIYLFGKYKNPVPLEKLIEGTQYGFNASALPSGKNKFLRISDIYESKVDWDSVPYCNCDDEKTYLLKNEDILIARTGGTTGKSFKIHNPPKHSIYAGYLIRIRAKAEVNPNYIYLFLHSFAYWSQIVNLNERNFRPKANAENLKALVLPDCPKDIQDEVVRIAEGENVKGYEDLFKEIEKTLSEYDKVRTVEDLLADQFTQVENLNQAILQEALQGKLVEQDPNDESATELLSRIRTEKTDSGKKGKPLASIKPEEIPFATSSNWTWCKLGDVCEKIHYGFNASAIDNKPGAKLLRITDIQDNKVNWQSVPGCDYTESDFENYLLRENDIVIARTGGTIGKSFLVSSIPITCLFASYLIRAIPSTHVSPQFLKYFLESPLYWSQLYEEAWGAGQPNVNGTALSNLILPLPPLKEQERIVKEIESQLLKIKNLKERIIADQLFIEKLLIALLHQAFEVSELEVAEEEGVIALDAEPEVMYGNGKIVPLHPPQEKEENHFVKRKILATYIINQSLNDSYFGDVKFEKLLHLSDYFAIKRNLGQKFYKKVAGPLDNTFTTQYFKQIEQSKWFNRRKAGRQFTFSAGSNHKKSLKTYDYFSDEELGKVSKIISYFKKSDYEKPEIVSTLYAAWNNRLIKNESISDSALIADFYDWDEAKKKYTKERLIKAIQWMREEKFIPDGWGNYIDKPKAIRKVI